MCSGLRNGGLTRSCSAPGLNPRPASQVAGRTQPGALRRCPGSWGSFRPDSSHFNARDVARTLRVNQRPQTADLQTASAQHVPLAQHKLELGRNICEFNAKHVTLPGPSTGPGGGSLQKVQFFSDKIIVFPGPLADHIHGTALDFSRIGHAELDGRTCSLKLRLAGPQGTEKRSGGCSPSGYVAIQLEQSDFDTLRSLVWPLLLQSVVAERKVSLGTKFKGPLRGPSLVWSHA